VGFLEVLAASMITTMLSVRSAILFLVALLLLASPAAATWSIVIVDLVTGEVAIGIATCVLLADLRPNAIVVIPGVGVAAAQSFVGPLALRELIRDAMLAGTPVQQILQQLASADPLHPTRQYGLVALAGGAATFTGSTAGAWAGGRTGQSGSLLYAIQGNVLTGQPVVTAAEVALQTTIGTLGDKLMAAMHVVPAVAPTITSIAPAVPTPGQQVTVLGRDFMIGMTATLSGAPLPIEVSSTAALTFVAPPGVACTAPLVLSSLGASVQSLLNASPIVTSSTPAGPAIGGGTLVLGGQNLLGCTVTVRGVPLAITLQTASTIIGLLPANPAGPTTIVIRNANGCQTTRNFTYL
jgi:hypothetical protein